MGVPQQGLQLRQEHRAPPLDRRHSVGGLIQLAGVQPDDQFGRPTDAPPPAAIRGRFVGRGSVPLDAGSTSIVAAVLVVGTPGEASERQGLLAENVASHHPERRRTSSSHEPVVRKVTLKMIESLIQVEPVARVEPPHRSQCPSLI